MKRAVLILMIIVVPEICLSQGTGLVVWLDTSATKAKAVMDSYDSLYAPAASFLPGDSIAAAWYGGFLPAFEKQIEDMHLIWPETTFVWVDLCCERSGKVERIFMGSRQLKDNELGRAFQGKLSTFCQGYVLPLRAEKRYSQCGTLRFPLKAKK